MTEIVVEKPQERFQLVLKSDKYRERISPVSYTHLTLPTN